MTTSTPRALDGLRVLDLTDESGQLAGRILADLGADVLKIEPPSGDALRRRGPFVGGEPHPDAGVTWIARNLGKRSLALDLARPDDVERLRELARAADVWLVSAATGDTARGGLDVAALRALNPRLVVCTITPYGADGPKAALRGSDLTALAASGNLFMTGDADRAPLRCSMPVTHYHGAAEAALGICFALWHRDQSGEGQHVDVALQELMLMPNMTHPAQAWVQGYRGQRSGNFNRVGETVQQEIWPCKDGFVSFAMRGGAARIPGLIAITKYMDEHGMAPPVLKERDWSKYNNNLLTQAQVDEIAAPFAAFFRTKTMQELYDAACNRRLMLAPANTEREIFASRQLAARQYFTTRRLGPGAGAPLQLPSRFAAFPLARVGERAPSLGDADGFAADDAFPSAASPSAGATGERRGIFHGLKVLEFGAGAAAPLATRYFADQGATVIKIESKQRPDFLRTLRDDGSGKLDSSLFFACINPNKLSAGLNMKDPRAIGIAKRLIGWADLVIENFAPGVMQKWGLDYATIRDEFPGLIMVSTCLWGQTGPERAYPGFGGQGSALAGFNYLTGWPDREPLGPFGTITDSISPRYAVVALAAALLHRARTGEGAYLDVSQVETGVYGLTEWLLAHAATGDSVGRAGNRAAHAAPHGVFPCAGQDRWIAIAIHDDADWQRLVRAMGAPDWATAAALQTLDGRLAALDELEAAVAAWTRPQEASVLAAALQAAGVDAAAVADMQDLLKDPQLAHRGHFTELTHAVVGKYVVEAMGLRFSAAPMHFHRPAPLLAADSEQAYCELLGMDRAEFESLRDAGVLT
ncbi:MAG: CoA transferase [Deltaproteobacteria bacterium]|nr:CoA transferase [Deltaproteobacteria bacterium]